MDNSGRALLLYACLSSNQVSTCGHHGNVGKFSTQKIIILHVDFSIFKTKQLPLNIALGFYCAPVVEQIVLNNNMYLNWE